MRKILFRGRDTTGKWHKGTLIISVDETTAPYEVHYIKGQGFAEEEHEVEPETTGELVLPATEEHPDIWEGDIIENENGLRAEVKYNPYKNTFHVIVRSETSTLYDSLDEDSIVFEFKYNKAKVVGNIHDNPELITKPFCDHAQKGQTN